MSVAEGRAVTAPTRAPRHIVAALVAAWPALSAGAAALALYLRTLAPGLTWAHAGADGGDLLAAALTAGVPHPTGYPTYQLLLRGAIALQPAAPARAGNLLSAVCAALTAALLADLARRVLDQLFPRRRGPNAMAAVVAALAWAAAPAVWAQATLTEVYTLNALACVLLLGWLWRFAQARSAGRAGVGLLAAAGLTAGLGLGVHLTLALLLPGAALWAWRAVRDGRGRGPALLAGALGLALGLTVYAYLPLMAAHRPPINWGDPATPAGFFWVVTGRLYAPLVLGAPLADAWPRTWAFLREGAEQFGGPWGAAAALGGLALLARRLRGLWLATLLGAAGFALHAITYAAADSLVNLAPLWALAALWLAVALGWTMAWVAGKMGARVALLIPALALLLGPGVALVRHWDYNDLSRDRAAAALGQAMLAEAAPDAIVLTATDGPTFLLWYLRYGLAQREDLTPVNVALLGYAWYRATLQAHHPAALGGIDLAADPAAWLPDVAARRPVYRAEALGLTVGLAEEPGPTLVRLRPAPLRK